ncbi:hypothetical protein PsAD37_02788 [Pseudovibrio sp. Ad37]|nr:hypothetical protein PsAD37_02788 [Pseudovibrio sp. Ad37]
MSNPEAKKNGESGRWLPGLLVGVIIVQTVFVGAALLAYQKIDQSNVQGVRPANPTYKTEIGPVTLA